MSIFLIIVYVLAAALLVWFVYWCFRDSDHFLLLENKYRMMVRIRSCYLKGQKSQPRDSEEYFQRKAAKIINDYKSIFGPLERKEDLSFHKETVTKMLSRKEYYQYYFTKGRSNLQWFRRMYEDYRSGVYETYPYDQESHLKSVLPGQISKNKTLVRDISKFIAAGWLDENGLPLPEIRKQQLALAASIICEHAGVRNYHELFGSYWGINPSTMRSNKRNALENIDGGDLQIEIERILEISHFSCVLFLEKNHRHSPGNDGDSFSQSRNM